MDLPFVSVATCTYGRPALLEEAIESFFRQDYPGPKEMVVLNTLTAQRLSLDHPEVRVINWPERPAKLGTARNLCIDACQGMVIVSLDDDDLLRPHYVRMAVSDMQLTGKEWLRPGGLITLIDRTSFQVRAGGAVNQLIYTKVLWRNVGGYPDQNSGEDAGFVERLDSAAVKGSVHHPLEESGYIYGWGTNGGLVRHASYDPVEEAGQQSDGAEKTKAFVSDLIARGRIPTGDVLLRPHWKQDYEAEFLKWLANRPPTK